MRACRLQDQRLVVPLLLHERQQVLLAQALDLGADDVQLDPRPDGDRVGEVDRPRLGVGALLRQVDARRAVALLDEPGLEALGVVAHAAAAVGLARLGLEALDQLVGGEGCRLPLKSDRADPRPRAAGDLVDDVGAAALLVDRHPHAHLGLEVAALAEEVLHLVDAAHHAVLDQRVSRALRHHPPQLALGDPELAFEQHALDPHHRVQDDGDDHAVLPLRGPRVELDLRGRAARLHVAQGAADPLVGEGLAHLDGEERAHLLALLLRQRGLAADLDRAHRSGPSPQARPPPARRLPVLAPAPPPRAPAAAPFRAPRRAAFKSASPTRRRRRRSRPCRRGSAPARRSPAPATRRAAGTPRRTPGCSSR